MKSILIICSLMFSFSAWSWWDKKTTKKTTKSKAKVVAPKINPKRKVATAYNSSHVKKDVKDLGKDIQALKAKSRENGKNKGAEIYASVESLENIMSTAIKDAEASDSKKTIPYKMIAGGFKVQETLRGIIWKMKPLFEYKFVEGKRRGNKMLHMGSVQLLRGISTSLHDYIPNNHAGLMFDYLNTPKKEWKNIENQFVGVDSLQDYLEKTVAGELSKQASALEEIYRANPEGVYVFDNQWAFGENTFPDKAKRYSAIGPGEILLMISSTHRAIHDINIFASRNLNGLLDLVGDLGVGVGIDAFGLKKIFNPSEVGLSDRERVAIVKAKMNGGFLERRKTSAITKAKASLELSMTYYGLAYEYFTSDNFPSKRELPEAIKNTSQRAYENMKAIIKGKAEIKDPLTGKSVTVNIHPFYDKPPKSLVRFLPNQFNTKADEVFTIKSGSRELAFRNYNFGQSKGWSNSRWNTYVRIDGGDLMEAKRIMANSGGVFKVFRLPVMFIR